MKFLTKAHPNQCNLSINNSSAKLRQDEIVKYQHFLLLSVRKAK